MVIRSSAAELMKASPYQQVVKAETPTRQQHLQHNYAGVVAKHEYYPMYTGALFPATERTQRFRLDQLAAQQTDRQTDMGYFKIGSSSSSKGGRWELWW